MNANLQELVAGLTSTDLATRREAAERLMGMGADAESAAVSLCMATADPDELVREAATAAIEELGAPTPAARAELAELLRSQAADPAYWAATLLGRSGPDAASHVPELAAALTAHPAINVRQRCAWALSQVGSAAAGGLAALQQAAKSDDPRLARLAQDAISKIQAA